MIEAGHNVRTSDATLMSLYHVQIKHNRTYSFIKRVTLQSFIKRFYGLQRCLSDIDYHLGNLRKKGLIKVHQRYGTRPDGTHFLLSSNRSLTRKGLIYLRKILVKVPKWLWDWAFKGVKLPRKSYKPGPTKYYKITTRPPRRSVAFPESLQSVLKNSLETLQI